MSKIWFDDVSRRDARLLVSWWNNHSKLHVWYYAVSHPSKSKRWQVIRTVTN